MRFARESYNRLLTTLSLLAMFLVIGCGSSDRWKDGRPPVYPASGRVMMNGQPLEGATVIFSPEDSAGKPGVAITDKSGRYFAETFEPKDGLTAGPHKVTVEKTTLVDKQGNPVEVIREPGDVKEVREVPKQYSNFATSGLRVEVKDGKNELPAFELKK